MFNVLCVCAACISLCVVYCAMCTSVCYCGCYVFISYLNVFEEKDYMVEKKFFEANPNKGTLYNKIIGKATHTVM